MPVDNRRRHAPTWDTLGYMDDWTDLDHAYLEAFDDHPDLPAYPRAVTDRPTYPDLMGAINELMLAHTDEVHGGRTEELRAVTNAAYARVAQLVYAATDRPARPAEPGEDPKLPIRRGIPRPTDEPTQRPPGW